MEYQQMAAQMLPFVRALAIGHAFLAAFFFLAGWNPPAKGFAVIAAIFLGGAVLLSVMQADAGPRSIPLNKIATANSGGTDYGRE
jgi:hypothetical protein